MYKLLNDGDIIYNSKTGPNVGKVATLWGLVPNVFIRLIGLRFFSLQEKKNTSLLTNPFVYVHFNLSHTNASLQMQFFGNRHRSNFFVDGLEIVQRL